MDVVLKARRVKWPGSHCCHLNNVI